MLFALMLIAVPAGLLGQLLWTLRSGRLPRVALLSGVTREEMPTPFWLYVVGLSFTILVSAAFATMLLTAGQRTS